MTLAVLIPAAGCSSRLGQSKQLVEIQKRPLLQNRIRLCAEVVSKVNGKVYCVLGANAHEIRHHVIDPRCRFLFYAQWQNGLAHSIAFGINQLPAPISAALILLSDQWAIKEDDINQLIEQYKRNPTKIIASRYNGTIGVPAVFPRQYFETLTKVNAQSQFGAKKVLQQYIDEVVVTDINNAQFDLDTPCQLEYMQHKQMQLVQEQPK